VQPGAVLFELEKPHVPETSLYGGSGVVVPGAGVPVSLLSTVTVSASAVTGLVASKAQMQVAVLSANVKLRRAV
jgi:hypothetical protein